MLVVGNPEIAIFGRITLLTIDFAVNGVGRALRISREHLCRTPGRGKKHRLAINVM